MKIVIDYKLDNLNELINKSRGNKFYANNTKRKEMNVCKLFLKDIPPIKEYPIKLNCLWHIKNLASDLDNKLIKNLLDEMQELGILANDNAKHINEINHKVVKDNKDYLEMEVIYNGK